MNYEAWSLFISHKSDFPNLYTLKPVKIDNANEFFPQNSSNFLVIFLTTSLLLMENYLQFDIHNVVCCVGVGQSYPVCNTGGCGSVLIARGVSP